MHDADTLTPRALTKVYDSIDRLLYATMPYQEDLGCLVIGQISDLEQSHSFLIKLWHMGPTEG